MSKRTLCIYHDRCPDGFAAAWVAWKHFGDSATYLPASYGKPYPQQIDAGLDALYLLDFSYPAETLRHFQTLTPRLEVFDHHDSMEAELAEFARESSSGVHFDLQQCGATMAWAHFFPNEPLPKLLEYVRDRDLWKWELPHSRAVSAVIASWPWEFAQFDALVSRADTDAGLQQIAAEGEGIMRFQRQEAAAIAAGAWLEQWEVDGAMVEVPVVNCTSLHSEVGHVLNDRCPDAPFSVTFRQDAEITRWSLRTQGNFDVGSYVRARGGGGQRKAGGFETPR